jgi:hypothetical protein
MHWGKHLEPWEHWTVNNVINTDDFPELQKRVASWEKTPPDKRRISKFILNQEEPKEGYICDPWVYGLLNRRFDLLMKSIDYSNYIPIFEYNSCPAGYQYPIHVDAPEKIASLVIFISEYGDGTKIYNDKHELVKQIPWRANDGFYFFRYDDTWHSYESNVNHRDTINCILVKRDKELLKNLRYDVDV